MRITIENQNKLITSTLLVSVIKQEINFENNYSFKGKDILPETILKNLNKRLDVPLPLDKSFVHEAIKEYLQIEKEILGKEFEITL